MIINFLGDSITAGAGASAVEKKYVNLVGQALNCEVRNYGIGGTRIAKQKSKSACELYDLDFQRRVEEMDGQADLVFVFGGTNDWGHGDAEIGKKNDDDAYTFYGGLNNLIKLLSDKYGKERLIFILPLKRYGESNPYGEGNKEKPSLPLSGYVAIIKEVLEGYGIEYLDLYNDGPAEPMTNENEGYFFDGVHPNDEGHKFIADKIISYLKKNY